MTMMAPTTPVTDDPQLVTLPDDFGGAGSVLDVGSGDAPPAIVEEPDVPVDGAEPPAAPPAAPAAVPAWQSEIATLKTQLAEQQAWRQQQETERAARAVQEQQAQLGQAIERRTAELATELMSTYGVDEQKAQGLAQFQATAEFLGTPQGQQRLVQAVINSQQFAQTEWFQKAASHARYEHATGLVEKYILPTIPSTIDGHYTTPHQVAEIIAEHRKKFVEIGDPAAMEREAIRIRDHRRAMNRQGNIQSGQETIERGGGQGSPGGMTDQQFMDRFSAEDGGGIPNTVENIRRAARLQSMGIFGRAR